MYMTHVDDALLTSRKKCALGKGVIKLNHSRVSDLMIQYGVHSRDVYTLPSHEKSLSQKIDQLG